MEAREPWSAGRSFLPLKRREEQSRGQRCLGADRERTVRLSFLITHASAIHHGQSACAPLHTQHILEGSGEEVLTSPLHAALGTTARSPRHSRGSTVTHSTWWVQRKPGGMRGVFAQKMPLRPEPHTHSPRAGSLSRGGSRVL